MWFVDQASEWYDFLQLMSPLWRDYIWQSKVKSEADQNDRVEKAS